MPGNQIGGLRAAATNKQLYGKDFYVRIGRQGGQVRTPTKGFGGMTPEKRSAAGKVGGAKSSRLGVKTGHAKSRIEREPFFVQDSEIDTANIIEPFVKTRFYEGWFKRKEQ